MNTEKKRMAGEESLTILVKVVKLGNVIEVRLGDRLNLERVMAEMVCVWWRMVVEVMAKPFMAFPFFSHFLQRIFKAQRL